MALNANLPNFYIQWPNDAASTLIHHRRAYQIYFCTTPMQQQRRLWRRIARAIQTAHPNFTPDKNQCRTKWNALKSGYENMERLLNGNLQRFLTRTPSLHDELFHGELSDEFWLTERNYLLLTDFFTNSSHLY